MPCGVVHGRDESMLDESLRDVTGGGLLGDEVRGLRTTEVAMPRDSINTLKHPRLGLAGVAAMVAVCVTALALTGAGPADDAATPGADATAMQSQKCVLCGRSFAEKLAQLCTTCDRGKCFKCGGSFPDKVARVCSSCHKNKCISCGRSFPDKVAKLCNRCVN